MNLPSQALQIATDLRTTADQLAADSMSNKSRSFYAERIKALAATLVSAANRTGMYDPEQLDPTRRPA